MMLERGKTALAVVDFQDKLLGKIEGHEAIVPKAVKLIRFCRALEIPILWTEQYPKGLGPTNAVIAAELAGLTPIEKTEFGCMANPGFAAALAATGRTQLLVTGIEAHICVMQTVLSAVEKGLAVFVAEDAVGSTQASERAAGVARMERAGAEIVTAQMAMFEILRQAGTPDFKAVMDLLK